MQGADEDLIEAAKEQPNRHFLIYSRQAAFIRELEADSASVTVAELIADTLESMKVPLRI